MRPRSKYHVALATKPMSEKENVAFRQVVRQFLIELAIRALLERRARGEVAPWVRNTHLDSQYILTGLLRCKQDGRLMKGHTCGPREHKTRYYAHPIARKDPTLCGFPNVIFRADVLERELLRTLSETLLAMPDLRDEVRFAVEAAQNARKAAHPPKADDLQRELDAIRTKIKLTLELVTPETQEDAKAQLAHLGQRRRELEAQIKQAGEAGAAGPLDIDATVDSLITRLSNLAQELPSLPLHQLRQVVAAITQEMTADMQTREVALQLKVPKVAISDAKTPLHDLCLQQTSEFPTSSETQNHLMFGTYIRCEYSRPSGRPCYQCRRERRAA